MKRPNVLVIYTDQQRFDSLGIHGNIHAITPNLDRLAREGADCTNYYVNSPVCAPSRMSMLTGMFPSQLHIADNGIPLPEETPTAASILKKNGYETAQFGKLHFLPHTNRNHRNSDHPDYGFDTLILSDEPGCYDDAYIKWVEAKRPEQVEKCRVGLPSEGKTFHQPCYSEKARSPHQPYAFEGDEDCTHSAFVTEQICDFISRQKHSGKPFFAVAGFYAPHAPVNPPQKYLDLYDAEKMPLPKQESREYEFMSRYFGMRDLSGITTEKWKEIVAAYLALVTHVDECVGKILKAAADIREETLIIFTSDHGEYLGDHNRVHKGMPGHDCIIHVPFLVSLPGRITQGIQMTDLCETVDVLPTILDYCQIQQPEYMKGISLKPVLEGRKPSGKESVIVEYMNRDNFNEVCIRTDQYKYYVNTRGLELLFDLWSDPDEMNNIADEEHEPLLGVLRRQMLFKIMTSAYTSKERTAPY